MRRLVLSCCGYVVDAHSEVRVDNCQHRDVLPRKGDATICLNCGSWHRYKDNKGNTRPFDARDLEDFPDDQLHIMRRATRLIKKRGRMK